MLKQKVLQMKMNWALLILALGALLGACTDGGGVAGTSEESEGIVAIANKKLAGVSQKGPLVKDSKVIVRETADDGSFEPTGREFTTTTFNDSGEFRIDGINLDCQYVLVSAGGKYIREYDGEPSACPIRLDAVSDVRKRETVNLNLLTHFEYKRVLKLVKSGKSFVEAKKQAATEVLNAFGVSVNVSSAEDLNIYNSTDADRTLFNISQLIDNHPEWNSWVTQDDDEGCSKLQKLLDEFADDFEDDGVLSDSVMQFIVGSAYVMYQWYANMEYVDEYDIMDKEFADPDEAKDHFLAIKKKEYDFSKLVMQHYMEVEPCDDHLWGDYREFTKPIPYYQDTLVLGYILCNGFTWELATKEHIDSLTLRIDHEMGTMTDDRDGKTYKTVIFEHEGKRYEWMAENLQYTDSVVKYSKGWFRNDRLIGSYAWTTAMGLDGKYMNEPLAKNLLDTLHQGICPDGWHISTNEEWVALINYVGGPEKLFDETWKSSDRELALAKDLIGVFYNKFDFNLTPLSGIYLEAYYHSYTLDEGVMYLPPLSEDYTTRQFFTEDYPITSTFTTIEMSINWSYVAGAEKHSEGYVRCVKN